MLTVISITYHIGNKLDSWRYWWLCLKVTRGWNIVNTSPHFCTRRIRSFLLSNLRHMYLHIMEKEPEAGYGFPAREREPRTGVKKGEAVSIWFFCFGHALRVGALLNRRLPLQWSGHRLPLCRHGCGRMLAVQGYVFVPSCSFEAAWAKAAPVRAQRARSADEAS